MVGSRPDRVKPKTMKLVFTASAKHTVLSNKCKNWLAQSQYNVSKWSDMSTIKTGWLRASIMCPSGAICLLLKLVGSEPV